MKLHLTKNQSKKLLGGVKFEVKAKVELTDEERELVRRYKLEDEVLVSRKMSNMLGELTQGGRRNKHLRKAFNEWRYI